MVGNPIKVGAYTVSNDSFTFNATASGQAQVNQGQTVNATQTNHVAGELTVVKFFEAIEAEVKKLPEVQQQEVKQAVEPLKEIATGQVSDRSVADPKPEQSTFGKYLDMLRPHASLIARCVAAFGEQVLTKLAATDPSGVISGVLAVSREVRSASK